MNLASCNSMRFIALLLLLGVAACDSGTEPAGNASLSLSAAVPQSGAAGVARFGSGPARDIVQEDGEHTLVLTRAAVVLREVELEGSGDCYGDSGDDDCYEFEAGPYLLELPMDGSVETVVTVGVPAGTYDELEFEIHKPDDDDSEDLEFLQAHPEFKGVSIRVEGTFDGESFVFLQDLNAEQEVDLVPPMVVAEGSDPLNLTLVLDVTTWFVDSSGDLIDPRDANKGGPMEEVVEDNIEASIELFEDHDQDGKDDDEDDD